MKSETEITEGTRRTTFSVPDEMTYCTTLYTEITEEIQKPSVPSENDQITLRELPAEGEGGRLALEEKKEDLKSPVSEASSSSGSYSVTTDNGGGEREKAGRCYYLI